MSKTQTKLLFLEVLNRNVLHWDVLLYEVSNQHKRSSENHFNLSKQKDCKSTQVKSQLKYKSYSNISKTTKIHPSISLTRYIPFGIPRFPETVLASVGRRQGTPRTGRQFVAETTKLLFSFVPHFFTPKTSVGFFLKKYSSFMTIP